ncbi:MAG: ComF family protein [Patescibacteria group bacterium]|nr:ComF family protein [Patescibacteria group bacterium]
MNIIDFLFPKKCFGCGALGNYFCKICAQSLLVQKQICIECFRPSVDGKTHFRCQKKFSLDGFTIAYVYEGAIKKALTSLKYKFAYDIAFELAKMVVIRLLEISFLFPDNSLIIPVPLYKKRENWRGFNQSEILAKELAKFIEYEHKIGLIVKIKDHKVQARLSRTERLKNAKNIYKVLDQKGIYGRNIILVDDVVTTGATLREIGKVLKINGAKSVWGVAIAH